MKLDKKVIIIIFWRQSGSYSECVMRKLLSSLTISWKGVDNQKDESNKIIFIFLWFSLIYNTSARQEPHACDTSDTSTLRATRVQHGWDTSNTSVTQATRVRHEWHEQRDCDTIAARVKNFVNGTWKHIFTPIY